MKRSSLSRLLCFVGASAAMALTISAESENSDPDSNQIEIVGEDPEASNNVTLISNRALAPIDPFIDAVTLKEAKRVRKNRHFVIDLTRTSLGRSWYLADYDAPNGHWQNDFRTTGIISTPNGMKLSLLPNSEPGGWNWNGSRVSSNPPFKYGYYEVLMKSAPGSGVVSAMFTYTGPHFKTPHDEIDIEFLGKRPNHVEFNLWRDGVPHGKKKLELPFDTTKEFHYYGFEWSRDYVRWYIDGEMVYEFTERDKIPRKAGRIMLKIWTGKIYQWHGEPEFSPGVYAQYKCISYRPLRSRKPTCRDLHETHFAD